MLTNLAGWVALWHNGFRPPLAINPSRWQAMLVPSFHYAATTLMGTVYHRTGHIVVRWFLGDYALGLYAAAVRFVDLLRNFVRIAFSVLMPRIALSAQSPSGLRRLVQAAVSAMAIISIPLTLGTLATAHLVVPWVLGANYAAAVGPVRWTAGFLLAAPVASLLSGTVLYALGRHRACLISATAGAVAAARACSGAGSFLWFARRVRCVRSGRSNSRHHSLPLDSRGTARSMEESHYPGRGILGVADGGRGSLDQLLHRAAVDRGERRRAVVYMIALIVLGRKMLMQQFGDAR